MTTGPTPDDNEEPERAPEEQLKLKRVAMVRKDFHGVKDLFAYFTFNRSVNMTQKSREQTRSKVVQETFTPQINKESNEIAMTLMKKYWGGSSTSPVKTSP